MKKQFVTYEIALKLKELGFDEPCFGVFDLESEDRFKIRKPSFNMSNNSTKTLDEFGLLLSTEGVTGLIKAPLWQQAIEFLLKGLHQKYPYIHIMYVNPNEYSILMEQPKDTFTGRDYVDYGVETIEELVLKMIELYNIKNIL